VDAVVASNFQGGYDQLAALRSTFGKEPWFGDVRGSITAMLLETPPETMRVDGPKLAPSIPFHYDPMPVLRNLDVPQLWILGAEDVVAPASETSRRLATLAASGKPITTAIVPGADHGMYEYEVGRDGSRVSTRAPAGYFKIMRDFILKGRIAEDYGAEIVGRAANSQ
jgi:pimeloyl-ACP methyl ester carboxylesterase